MIVMKALLPARPNLAEFMVIALESTVTASVAFSREPELEISTISKLEMVRPQSGVYTTSGKLSESSPDPSS